MNASGNATMLDWAQFDAFLTQGYNQWSKSMSVGMQIMSIKTKEEDIVPSSKKKKNIHFGLKILFTIFKKLNAHFNLV